MGERSQCVAWTDETRCEEQDIPTCRCSFCERHCGERCHGSLEGCLKPHGRPRAECAVPLRDQVALAVFAAFATAERTSAGAETGQMLAADMGMKVQECFAIMAYQWADAFVAMRRERVTPLKRPENSRG